MGFIRSQHEVQKCVEFVVKTQTPLIFLAVGMPQQEILASHIADHPQAGGVGLCIGASIDFLTGQQRRAPVWVQKAGLEWLYRLLSDPRRLASRYLIDCPRIFYLICFRRRIARADSRARSRRSGVGTWTTRGESGEDSKISIAVPHDQAGTFEPR